jgi:hypothetical protein
MSSYGRNESVATEFTPEGWWKIAPGGGILRNRHATSSYGRNESVATEFTPEG